MEKLKLVFISAALILTNVYGEVTTNDLVSLHVKNINSTGYDNEELNRLSNNVLDRNWNMSLDGDGYIFNIYCSLMHSAVDCDNYYLCFVIQKNISHICFTIFTCNKIKI